MSQFNSYQFDMWQDHNTCEEKNHDQLFDLFDSFNVEHRINFVVQYLPNYHQLNFLSIKPCVNMKRNKLTNEAQVRHDMSSFLSSLPEQDRESIVTTISSTARALDSDSCNVGRKVIPVVISLRVFYLQDYTEDVDLAWLSTMGKSLHKFLNMPATEEAVNQLDKVVFDKGSCLTDQCPICWREFSVGEEVTRMPCMHLYHEDCIVQWLNKSCMCPSCRFPLPVCRVPETLFPYKTRRVARASEKKGARMSVPVPNMMIY